MNSRALSSSFPPAAHSRRILAAIAIATLSIPLATATRADIIVQQVEADIDQNSANGYQYAPVNFAGNPSYTGTGVFSGITFHAPDDQGSGTVSTYSSHAYTVAQDFYGTASVAYPYVNTVYNYNADTWLSDVVGVQDSTGLGPAPGAFDTGVHVSNSSWVGTYVGGTDTDTGATLTLATDTDAIRRVDFMANRDNVLVVAGAVTPITVNDKAQPSQLIWAAYNSLAVRGTQAFVLPDPTIGKTHPDLWLNTDASYGTATVSGYAAALWGNAQSLNFTDAQHDYLVKSLLMTGADKTVAHGSVPTANWGYNGPLLGNNLDPQLGAGYADYNNSLAILQGGERSTQSVSAGIVPLTASTASKGWASGTSTVNGNQAVLIYVPGGLTNLSATLTWDVTSSSGAGLIDTSDAAQIFAHLGLELRPVTPAGPNGTIGSAFADLGLNSDVTDDNVQALYYTGDLAAGYYAFLIEGDPAISTDYGFSYTFTPVPEPSTLLLLTLALPLLVSRRRRNQKEIRPGQNGI